MPAAKPKLKRAKSAAPKRSGLRARPRTELTNALAEAAWSEADTALAQALADFDEAESARSASVRADALARLGQSLARAARKRGLTRIGDLDARVTYDPATHELNAAVAKTPKSVRIQARGVARGGDLLEKPRVVPLERKKRP